MANYTIIGGDSKQYGPVTGEEIRQWIAEGRLDGRSLARSENDTEWRPLAAFPEFAPALSPRPVAPPPISALPGRNPDHGREAALEAVKNPAVCLILSGALNVVMALWGVVEALFFPVDIDQQISSMPQFNDPQIQKMINDPQIHNLLHLIYSKGALVGNDVFGLVMSILVVAGALRMKALRSYEFAFVAAILALVPCVTPCCLVGLPFGIWAIIVLRKPGIKGHFN